MLPARLMCLSHKRVAVHCELKLCNAWPHTHELPGASPSKVPFSPLPCRLGAASAVFGLYRTLNRLSISGSLYAYSQAGGSPQRHGFASCSLYSRNQTATAVVLPQAWPAFRSCFEAFIEIRMNGFGCPAVHPPCSAYRKNGQIYCLPAL